MKTADALPEMTAEQSADLAALQAGANEQTDAIAAAAPAEYAPDMAAELAHLMTAFVLIAKPILPSLGRIYTEETTATAAGAVAAVCEKHGWMPGGLMGEWGVEIGAAVVLLPLGVATWQGVKSDMAENEKRTKFIEEKKKADMQQHMNIAHNADGRTEPTPGATFSQVLPSAND